jgi:hypothetical protein
MLVAVLDLRLTLVKVGDRLRVFPLPRLAGSRRLLAAALSSRSVDKRRADEQNLGRASRRHGDRFWGSCRLRT